MSGAETGPAAESPAAKAPPPAPPPPPPPLPPANSTPDVDKTKEDVAAIMIEDDAGSDEDDDTSQSYNKLKYHSMKMDLNLRILKEEMVGVTKDFNYCQKYGPHFWWWITL